MLSANSRLAVDALAAAKPQLPWVVLGTYGSKRRTAAIVIERVMSIEAIGGASISSEIHVYKLAGRTPELVGIVDVGTPVHEIRFEGPAKLLVVSGNPVISQRFRLVDGVFVELPQPD